MTARHFFLVTPPFLLACLALASMLVLYACSKGDAALDTTAEHAPAASAESQGSATSQTERGVENVYITVNGNRLKVDLIDNSSTRALTELLREGPLSYEADDYGGFEKVGDLGHSLPANDEQLTTKAGDVILYKGRCICIYYAQNSWSFTRLGRIADTGKLKQQLGSGRVTVTLSLD